MSERPKAEDAIYSRVSKLAEDAGAEDLERLSRATMNVAYGPQGAESHTRADNTQQTDYHATNHQGERQARPTGFEDGE